MQHKQIARAGEDNQEKGWGAQVEWNWGEEMCKGRRKTNDKKTNQHKVVTVQRAENLWDDYKSCVSGALT